jgi:hypothetical protein
MNSTSFLGMAVGGVLVSLLGGIAEYMKEKEFPQVKGLVRDFFIGAVMVLFVLQIVPDSMTNLLGFLPPLPAFPSISTSSIEPDLQVGPARF